MFFIWSTCGQQLTSKGNSLFIESFHHTLHLMPSGRSWSFHDLHKVYSLHDEFTHLSIPQVSINPRICLCHRPGKRIILSWLYEQGSDLISIHYLVRGHRIINSRRLTINTFFKNWRKRFRIRRISSRFKENSFFLFLWSN